MRLASVLTPLSDRNLTLAAQCGVDEIVARYPRDEPGSMGDIQRRVADFGMRIGVIEGGLPIDRLKTGEDDGSQMRQFQDMVRHLGDLGIPLVCYNFMAGTDWIRTRVDAPERGGSLTTAFDLAEAERAQVPGREGQGEGKAMAVTGMTADRLWTNLERFLTEVLPVAEDAGVTLVMHPDDPPVPSLLGNERIMYDVAGFERLIDLVPSPSNRIGFCQGTFSEMGIDIPATIRRLGDKIGYVHFRDVRGTPESFAETWQDNGQTDMAEAMRAYRDIGYDGPMRPDHVPQLIGEEDGTPGYTMLGRLFAYGYIRGLMHATAP
jgi:mannonate dehydratase